MLTEHQRSELQKLWVLFYLPPGPLRAIVREAAISARMRPLEADCVTDLIAIPVFLCIVDPAYCSHTEWEELCEGYQELQTSEPKFVLTERVPYPEQLPDANLLPTSLPFDATLLPPLLLQQRSPIA